MRALARLSGSPSSITSRISAMPTFSMPDRPSISTPSGARLTIDPRTRLPSARTTESSARPAALSTASRKPAVMNPGPTKRGRREMRLGCT